MTRILIVEDAGWVCKVMAKILINLGEISFAQKVGEGMRGPRFDGMLEEGEVAEKIANADLILLDQDLGCDCNYKGRDLLPLCKGKKVISISSTFELSSICFKCKDDLANDTRRDKTAEILYNLVKEVIEN